MDTIDRIESYLTQYPYSSTRQVALVLGVSVSTVRRHLREFRARGILGKRAHWVSQFGYTTEYYLRDPHEV